MDGECLVECNQECPLTTPKDAIFDRLRQKYLDSVQLRVLPNKNNRQNVIETYTFQIDYIEGNRPAERAFNGLTVSSQEGKTVTIQDARNGLDHIIRNLVVLTEALPFLPRLLEKPATACRGLTCSSNSLP